MVLSRWAARIGIASLLLGVLFVGGVVFLGRDWIAHGIAAAPNAGRTFRTEDDPPPEDLAALGIAQQLRVDVASACGRRISFSVWIIEPKTQVLGTVFVLHGVRSDKSWLKGLATRVAEQGYRAVLPDLPGHGRSSGNWLTYGACEAPEMKALVDALANSGQLMGNLGVVGISYGAAVGIQLAALEPRVRAVVAVAPFSSLRAVVPGYVDYYLPALSHLIPDSLVQQGIDRAGQLGNFSPDVASPLAALSRTQAQVLLVHGLADAHIAAAQSRVLHAAAATHSELVLVEGDDHLSIASDRSKAIQNRGMAWLHRWLDTPLPGAQSH